MERDLGVELLDVGRDEQVEIARLVREARPGGVEALLRASGGVPGGVGLSLREQRLAFDDDRDDPRGGRARVDLEGAGDGQGLVGLPAQKVELGEARLRRAAIGQARRRVERAPERLLRVVDALQAQVRVAEELQVVEVVPVVAGPDVLGLRVGDLDRIRLLELGERLFPAPEARQDVAVHVLGVRHARARGGVDLPVLRGLGVVGDVLEGMDEVVVRGEVPGRPDERRLVERDRGRPAELAPAPRPGSSALPRRIQSSASSG